MIAHEADALNKGLLNAPAFYRTILTTKHTQRLYYVDSMSTATKLKK